VAWPSRRAEERGERREERGGRGRGAAMRQASGVQDQVTSPLHGTPTPFTASSAWSPQHALPLLLLLLLRPASRINQDTLCLASHCVQNLRQYCRIIHRKQQQQQQQQQQQPPPHDLSWPSQLQQTPFPRLSPVSYRCRQQQQQPHVVAEPSPSSTSTLGGSHASSHAAGPSQWSGHATRRAAPPQVMARQQSSAQPAKPIIST
jgi:hypothetical protein